MDTEDRKRIIDELCESLKERMTKAADIMPEEWDGHELRLYAADIMLGMAQGIPQSRRRRYQVTAAEYRIF